jgi:hypothetical protein
MRTPLIRYFVAGGALAVTLLTSAVRADVLVDQVDMVGLPSVAQPSNYSFTAASAQALTLTLTDFQIPAAFASLQVAVTLGDALVGSVSVDATTHKATLAIPSAAGNYALHVIGDPDATQGVGSFGVCVAPATSASSCIAAYSFSGNIQTPSTRSTTGNSTLNTNFTSTLAGTYTVTVTDDAFPAALQALAGGISQGSAPIGSLNEGTTQLTLAAATSYQLILAAVASAATPAGLYSVRITDPSGAAVFNRTLPVGTMPSATIIDNTTAQSLSLNLTDYGYPAALTSAGAAVTSGAQLLATLPSPGALNNFSAPAGSLEIWQYAAAGAEPGVYSLNLSVYQAASTVPSLFSTTQVVNPPANAGATSYAFIATLPSAGTYNLVVSDFKFPFAFQSVSGSVAQNSSVLTQNANGDFSAAAGAVVVLVNVTPPQGGNGIFGVTVQTSGASPQILLDQTQAVGGVFNSQSINLGTSGSYATTLTDLGFPADFENLAVAVSRGSQVVGKIYGHGTFDFPATPGSYVLTFVATPSNQNYGLYSIQVASAVPTLTLSASASSVTVGQTVNLTWSSQNAAMCTAGGSSGWTGDEALSGTTAVIVSATTTYTLTCTGPGGSATQSVSVTGTPAPAASGGGGGGRMDPAWLGVLAVLAALRGAGVRGFRDHRRS